MAFSEEDYKLQLAAMIYPTRDNIINASRRFVDKATSSIENELIRKHVYGEFANGIALMDMSRQQEIGSIAYYENSCWLDSTIQALLSTPVPYVYRTILYRPVKEDEKAHCQGLAQFNLSAFQRALLDIKEELQTGKKIVTACQNFRDTLLLCMAEDYNLDTLYTRIYAPLFYAIEIQQRYSPLDQGTFLEVFANLFAYDTRKSFFEFISAKGGYIGGYGSDNDLPKIISYFKEEIREGEYLHVINGLGDYSVISEWIRTIPEELAQRIYKSVVLRHDANNAGQIIETLFKIFGERPTIIYLHKTDKIDNIIDGNIAVDLRSVKSDMLILNGDGVVRFDKKAPEMIKGLALFSIIVGIDDDTHYVSFIKFNNDWFYFNDMDISSVRYIERGTKIKYIKVIEADPKKGILRHTKSIDITISTSGYYRVKYADSDREVPRTPIAITNDKPLTPHRTKYTYHQIMTLNSFVSEFGKPDRINVKKDARIWFYKQ